MPPHQDHSAAGGEVGQLKTGLTLRLSSPRGARCVQVQPFASTSFLSVRACPYTGLLPLRRSVFAVLEGRMRLLVTGSSQKEQMLWFLLLCRVLAHPSSSCQPRSAPPLWSRSSPFHRCHRGLPLLRKRTVKKERPRTTVQVSVGKVGHRRRKQECKMRK